MPDDFAQPLAGNTETRRFFAGLNHGNQRRIVTPIDDAKHPAIRARRIAAAVVRLREGRV